MLAVIATGCGEAAPQSKVSFVTKANEICKSLVVEQRRAFKQLGASYTAGPNELGDGIEAIRDVIATRLERIKDLGRPKEPPRTYIASLRMYVRELENSPTSKPLSGVVNPRPVQQVLKEQQPKVISEAKAYGMGKCRELDAKPLPIAAQPLDRFAPADEPR